MTCTRAPYVWCRDCEDGTSKPFDPSPDIASAFRRGQECGSIVAARADPTGRARVSGSSHKSGTPRDPAGGKGGLGTEAWRLIFSASGGPGVLATVTEAASSPKSSRRRLLRTMLGKDYPAVSFIRGEQPPARGAGGRVPTVVQWVLSAPCQEPACPFGTPRPTGGRLRTSSKPTCDHACWRAT